jgi:hypothetical protein
VYTSILSSAMVSPLRLGIFFWGKTCFSLAKSYGTQRKRQCEPVGCGMIGGCYQKRKEAAEPVLLGEGGCGRGAYPPAQ